MHLQQAKLASALRIDHTAALSQPPAIFFSPQVTHADRFGLKSTALSHSQDLVKNGKSTLKGNVVFAPGHKGNELTELNGTQILNNKVVIGSMTGEAIDQNKLVPVLTESKNGHTFTVLPVQNADGKVTHLVIGNGGSRIEANGVTASIGEVPKAPPALKAEQATFSKKHILSGPLKEAPVLALAGGDGTRAWPVVHEQIGRGKAATSFYIEKQGNKTRPVSVWEEINRGLFVAGFKNVLTNTRENNADSLKPLVEETNEWKDNAPYWAQHLKTEGLDSVENKDYSVKLVPEKISGGQGSLIYWASKDKDLKMQDKPVVLMATDAHIQLPWGDIEKAYEKLAKKEEGKPFVMSLYEPIPAEKVANTYGTVKYGDSAADNVDVELSGGHHTALRRVAEFKEKPDHGPELDNVSYAGADGKPKADRRLLIEIMSPQAVNKFVKSFDDWTNKHLGAGMADKSQTEIEEAVLEKQNKETAEKGKIKEFKEPYDFTKDSILKKMVADRDVDVYTYPVEDAWGDLGCPAMMREIANVLETGEGAQKGIPFKPGTLKVSGEVLPTLADEKHPGHLLVNATPAAWKTLEKQGIKAEGNVSIVAANGVEDKEGNFFSRLFAGFINLIPFIGGDK